MGVLKTIGNGLRWVALQVLRGTGNLISWGARKLWRFSVRTGVFLWHRVRGESGSVIVKLDKQGTCVSMEVYDSKGKHIKDGRSMDITSFYRKNFLNGVPDQTVAVYRVNNINPFRKRVDKVLGNFGPESRYLAKLKPESRISIREEHWKYKNGVIQGGLSADQQMLFQMFNSQQDLLMEQSALNVAMAEGHIDKIMNIISKSALSQDMGDFNLKIAQCEQHADELLSFMPGDKVKELIDIMQMTDPSLKGGDAVERLSGVPVSYITLQQLFYLRCMSKSELSPLNSRAADIVDRYDFNKAWEKDGISRFHQSDDSAKAELVKSAVRVGNFAAVERMGEALFLEMFNQSNIRSRNMYRETVRAFSDAYTSMAGGQSALLEYYHLIGMKRQMCEQIATAAEGSRDYLFHPDYEEKKYQLEQLNKSLDAVYASPQIIGLELQKVDSLINMYLVGTVKRPDGQLRQDVAEALAALVYNLREAGYSEPVLQKLSKTDILDATAMQQALRNYMFSDDELQPYRLEKDNEPAQEHSSRTVTTEENVSNGVGQGGPEMYEEPARRLTEVVNRELENRLKSIHAKYGPLVNINFDDRQILPFPQAYMEDMMIREPETLEDIIRQVGAEALAYRNGELTTEELAHCPCYEPYFKGNGRDDEYLAQKMTEYWMERSSSTQAMAVDSEVKIPVSGDREMPLSADTPLGKTVARSDEFIEKVDSIVQKYEPHATFEQYCTMVCPSEKAYDIWSNPNNQEIFSHLMDECVAMSMAYRNGEVSAKELVEVIPGGRVGGDYSKEHADRLCNRVMGIYEGRIQSTVEHPVIEQEEAVRGHGLRR